MPALPAAATVVLITTDTLPRDHVSAYPDASAGTPNLDAIAAGGLRFDDAVSAAPLTLPSHATLLSGWHPTAHGVFRNGMLLPAELEGVPLALGRAGFYTGAFVSSRILHGSQGMGRWFDVYRDALGPRAVADELLLVSAVLSGYDWLTGAAPDALVKEPGHLTVSRALTWLDSLPEGAPVFLWVHLYDAHRPFEEPSLDLRPSVEVDPCPWSPHPTALRRSAWHPIRPRTPPIAATERCRTLPWTDLAQEVASYRSAVEYLDRQVGVLVSGLDARDRWTEAAVVVVADHGESLVEHQHHVSHQYSLYDPVVRVPLFIRAPGVHGTRSETVSTARVAATLRELAGLAPDPELVGPSLLTEVDDQPIAVGPAPVRRVKGRKGAVIQAVARWGGRKILVDELGHVERYDLRKDVLELRPGLTSTEQDAVSAAVDLRLDPERIATDPMVALWGPVQPASRESFLQEGLRGQLLTAEQAEEFGFHEEAARAAMERLRRVTSMNRETEEVSDEIRQSLEALGYVQ